LDKKKAKLFFTVFSTRTKNKVEKRISFFIEHEVLFYETDFFRIRARTLSANHATTEAADCGRLVSQANP
jgi:hypothetical protein